jgi:hypothetical protein
MTLKSEKSGNRGKRKKTAKQSYAMGEDVTEALDRVASRSPAPAIKSLLVNHAVSIEVLPLLNIETDSELMSVLVEKIRYFENQIIEEEARVLEEEKGITQRQNG